MGEVDEFNQKNKYRKQGVALCPVMYGVSFTAKFLNQAAAMVQVFQDGSVMVAHGGVEMGQGLNTKMVQVCASQLGIPASSVRIPETASDKTANVVSTSASTGADLNGMAIVDACKTINSRLGPVRDRLGPEASFSEVCKAAWMDRIDLCAHGHYATPDLNFDWDAPGGGKGRPFNYYAYGAACSRVEIDTLSGDTHVLRSDIIHGVGRSLNPAIDIGQIEGAFVQGIGLFTLEDLYYLPDGTLFSNGPGSYKIPGVQNIPCQFNITLTRQEDNPRLLELNSSKAVGEPPLTLSISVFQAVKEAIRAAREECPTLAGTYFTQRSPATPERVVTLVEGKEI
eukprot:NODE_235_length_1145_cov_1109.201642_g189_i0.p1 GENE.NODE_235_length_1145_cov_1109.201642_g189_i0~~NODE_235_length_1145_cov_1109.201642_g189_i0.p1  ORF type:complete len:340 (+),score=46.94 NODE_235_length_1145_cov_1109.201642_g189_i0:33-1052(+)